MLGLAQQPNWPKYHNVLNRVRWDRLAVANVLIKLLNATFLLLDKLAEVLVDETLGRHWSCKIKKKGH